MIGLVPLCLFVGAVLSALLSGYLPRPRPLWALLAAVCVVVAVLAGLALGRTM